MSPSTLGKKPVKPTTLPNHILPYLAYRKLPSENENEFRRLTLLIDHILHGGTSFSHCSHDHDKHEPAKYHTVSRARRPFSPPSLQSDTFPPSSTTPGLL